MKSLTTQKYFAILAFLISSTAFLGNVFARNFEKRFDQTLNGTILSASNVLITCDSTDPLCLGAQNFTGSVYHNGPFNMVNVDMDGDASTFNSSSADISFPASSTVVFAGLYWAGHFTDFGLPNKMIPPPNPAAKESVKFKVPNGNYVTVSGISDEEGGFYQGFADVTSLVSEAGQYWVADVQNTTGRQMNGGWTLVVVVKTAFEPQRRIVVWDGYLRHGIGDLTVVLPDSLGIRRAESSIEMGLVTYDGDKGKSDSLRIDGALFFPINTYPTTDPAPAGDIANSTIRTLGVRNENRNPSFKNTLGYDADVFEIRDYVNSDNDLDLLFRTGGDIKHIGLITVQSDVEERFIQTDWTAGTSPGTSNLLNSETGFLNRSGHIFHDTSPGDIRSVQFSYDYAGGLYEIIPVRSNTSDLDYINNWISTPGAAYPTPECNQSQFWLYREVDISRVSWLYGTNGLNFDCRGRMAASYTITGAFSGYGSIGNQSTPTGFSSSWARFFISAHLFRFSDREFRIAGNMISRSNSAPEHSVTIDDLGTEVPYDWNAPAPWALTSDFNGRLESKVFDALSPRAFGPLSFTFAQTNGSVARVFFRTGDSEANLLVSSWAGPFDNGDTMVTAATNNKQFFQYAIVTTLTDPAANSVESELVVDEIAFDLNAIASPFTQSTLGSWKRVDHEPTSNTFNSERLLKKALGKKLIPTSLDESFEATDFDIEFQPDDLDPLDPSVSCSSTGKTAIPWFALLLVGFLIGRTKKKK